MARNNFDKPHFFINANATPQKFTSPGGGGGNNKAVPPQNRSSHSNKLRGDLVAISNQLTTLKNEVSEVPLIMGIGIQVCLR